ncbi:SdrD B-like domain-containing protein, partial [Fibrella aquatica]|uniref:SdrD B-like domain-containing protein n=1 Tax=Fibrella aquatica TaxID=3242487 RepID=UPI003520F539
MLSTSAQAQVSGTVYREFKMNGVADAAVTNTFSSTGGVSAAIQTRFAEIGLTGALITVYGDNEQVLGNTTSAANGTWSVAVPGTYTGAQVLVECRLPTSLSALTPGPRGANNRTTVITVPRNSTGVDFTFGVGSQHAQDSPQVAFACFALPQPSNATGSPGSAEPMVIRFPYINGGPLTNATRAAANTTTSTGQNYYAPGQNPPVTSKAVLTTFGQTGTVYGLAYDKRRNRLLTSAFERAYTGIGANGGGGEGRIYVTTLDASGNATATALWLDLETALGANVAGVDPAITPNLSFTNTVAGVANPVTVQRFEHNKVGHLSLGDLEFSADGRTVYVVNLFSRQIYGIPVNADGTPNTAGIRTYTPTNPCGTGSFTDPATPAPSARPYNAVLGLGIHPENGRIYCTVTCTGPAAANLTGTIYSFDPAPATTTFRQEVQIPLNFTLQAGGTGTEGVYRNEPNIPWSTSANNSIVSNELTNNNVEHASLADIVFDIEPNGTTYMIVGGRNRFMDANSGSRTTTGQGVWIASSNGTSFTLENNGVVGSRTTANTLTLPWFSVRNGNGVFFNTNGTEGAYSTGNLIAIPGFTELAMGAVDNIRSAGNNGLTFLNRVNGSRTRDILLLGNLVTGEVARTDIYKANVWGEAEALLEAAPLEVGNYVFRDLNRNGIQDPSDTPIAGVRVSLVEDTNGDGLPNEPVSATTLTDANGQYYFTQAANGLKYDTRYVLVINRASDFATGGVLLNAIPAQANVSSNTKDTRDSDGEILTGSFVKTAFTTGAPGDNNHVFDFGFEPCLPPSVTFTASSNAVCQGQPVVLTTTVSPVGAYTYTIAGPAGVNITGGSTGTATVTNLNSGVNNFTVTVSSATCFTTSVVSVTSTPASLLGLTTSASAICVGQAVTLSTSLGGLIPLGSVVLNTVGALGSLTPLTSNILSPTATTTFLAQVPILGGLVSSCPVTVIVNQPPVLAPVNVSLCVGTPLNLTTLLGQNNILTGLINTLPGGASLPTNLTVGAGVNLFNVLSTNPLGCTATTPISVTGVPNPVLAPINLSVCVGSTLDLTSLTALTEVTNVFRSGGLLGLGNLLGTPTAVSIGAGVNLFNVVSTNPFGCTAATPISVTGVPAPAVSPINLSLCVGANLNLTSLTGLTGLTNVFRTGGLLGLGDVLGTPASVSVGAGVNLFNVVSTNPFGCTTATPISVTGVNPPVVAPIALSLCVGTSLDLTSLSGLTGLTNVFRQGGLLGLGNVLANPSVSIGTGVNLFNVVSTNPFGCTTATPISVSGVDAPVVAPINLSLCVGTSLDLTSLSGLTGLTNVFRQGGLLGLGNLLGTPTAVSVGAGVNLFNVVSTNPFGCTT